MRQILPILLGLIFSLAASAQTVILDFETPATSTTYQYFGSSLDGTLNNIIANPDPSGINTSSMVADHLRPVGAEVFAGAFANPAQATPFDFTSQSEVCIKVWFNEPGTVGIKFEGSTNGAPDWIGFADVTAVQSWTEVCVDVTQPSAQGPFESVVGGQYPLAVLFFDFETPTTEEKTYYFDDLVVNDGIAGLLADVTFSVDLNDYTDPFTQPYVSGSFNGWSGEANPLSDDDGDGIWETTIMGIPGGSHEYKFTFDNFAVQETFLGTETCTVTDPTGAFTNRSLFVDMASMVLGTNCFNSCYACGDAVNITFEVGATHISTSGDGIFIAGGGNFGVPGDYRLNDDDGDDVWTITFERQLGFSSFYSFANGFCPDFTCKENLAGLPCADPNNFDDRFLSSVGQDTLISTCYGQCTTSSADCAPAALDGNITFQVDMNDYPDPFTTVFVAGAFNGWSPDANPMTDANGDGIWETTILVPSGDQEYKFQLDAWTAQEEFIGGETCTITDPSGMFTNRLITVDGDASLCFIWNTCNECGFVPPPNRMVTFSVDMTDYADPFTTVFVSGSFNGWSGGSNPLADGDGDGIWEATIDLPEGPYEYKFQLDEWTIQEEFIGGEPCTLTDPTGEFTNRFLEVASDTSVCFNWNACAVCGSEPPVSRMVTFSVDMTDYADPFTTVFVSGSFNGWSGGGNPLADGDGDGIWDATIELPEGPYEYKFQLDEWTFQEEFAGGEPCTITDPSGEFTNRFLEVASDTIVCFNWNTCNECGFVPPPSRMVTFSVDMNNYTDPFTTAFVSGTFNGWSGGGNPLVDADGDGIWEATLSIPEGPYEYKFQLDEWTVDEQFMSGDPCTITDPTGEFVNRFIEIASDTSVCFEWNTCIVCDGPAPVNVLLQVDMSMYTEPFTTVFASGTFNGWSGDANPMADSDGDQIWELELSLFPGEYEYKFQLDNWTVDEQFMDGDPCTITDPTGQFVNRYLLVEEEVELCFIWETCLECGDVANRNLNVDPSLFELNPTLVKDFALITFNEQVLGGKTVRVFNSTGLLLQEYQVEASVEQQRIKTDNLVPGMYLVFVQSGNTIATKKFVKQ